MEAAIRRADAALALVVSDVVATTSVRQVAGIQRYAEGGFAPPPPPSRRGDRQGRRWPEAPAPGGVGEDEVLLDCRFGGHWFLLHGDRSMVEMAVHIASQVQDDVTMELWRAWPPCPSHAHPLVAEAVGGEAVWMCPADDGVAVPIGRLGADPAR